MSLSITENLSNKGGNYLLPFLWLHGEEKDILVEEIDKIQESGIGAFCIESRPHPDFGGPKWYEDVAFILEEAKKRDMKVWLLDDAHFPTGYANGLIKAKYPERRKKVLTWRVVQGCGPLKSATFLLSDNLPFWGINAQAKVDNVDNIVIVLAAKRLSSGKYEQVQDVTHLVKHHRLVWDMPEGIWCIFTVFETWAKHAPDYANLIDEASVQVLIEAIYEPHYEHFKADFGHTFKGFFSDEPGFGNGAGISNTEGFMHREAIGKEKLDLPWNQELAALLKAEWGADYGKNLLALWFDVENVSSSARYTYMDQVSTLYQKHFAQQLGNWCRERNVEYIGHIIEDNGAHSKLGCGVGHFFRALYGQDMAGIDSIADQTTPGFGEVNETFSMSERNGTFYHYALGKLGSSLAHIHPLKKGRALCEIFGASGWREGVKLMKWDVDHMLVRGINYFVPHAFSAKEFPDYDCPPHFYARGNNPQYRFFGDLMRYTNRMCHLLNGGKHIAPIALIYPAESEWAGKSMPVEIPAKELLMVQKDFDIIPVDVFCNREMFHTRMANGTLKVHEESYKAIVIPYGDYIPKALGEAIIEAQDAGIPVLFVDGLPKGYCEASAEGEFAEIAGRLNDCPVVSVEKLGDYLDKVNIGHLQLTSPQKELRYYQYEKATTTYFMFFNEAAYETIETQVSIQCSEIFGMSDNAYVYWYDALLNQKQTARYEMTGDTLKVNLKLSSYESRVLVIETEKLYKSDTSETSDTSDASFASDTIEACLTSVPEFAHQLIITPDWQVSFAKAIEGFQFKQQIQLPTLMDISQIEGYERFSGTVRYCGAFEWTEEHSCIGLDLGATYEAAQVWINGELIGTRICPPYTFTTSQCRLGTNELVIEVTNSLARQEYDFGSLGRALEPTGLLGPVVLKW